MAGRELPAVMTSNKSGTFLVYLKSTSSVFNTWVVKDSVDKKMIKLLDHTGDS